LRDEISVEDANEFAFCGLQPGGQCTCLETGAVDTMNALNIKARLTQLLAVCGRDLSCFISRIV
jgi:hypothetical protein